MTWTTAEARDRNRAQPIYLVEVQSLNSGPLLKFSDRNISISGVQYADYVGALTGLGDTLDRATAVFANASGKITFRNDPYDAFDYLSDLSETYPLEGAPVTVKVTYLDDDGTVTTPETIFVGNLDSPSAINLFAIEATAMCREAYASIANR